MLTFCETKTLTTMVYDIRKNVGMLIVAWNTKRCGGERDKKYEIDFEM